MANSINYAEIFNSVLDEVFYVLPRTNWMENTMPGLVWEGGKYIKIPKLSTPGLGTMSGNKAPDGDLTLAYETRQLQYYRGRNMTIGRYDVDETNLALTVSNAIRVFLNEEVVPEVDKLRISMAATAAYDAGKVSYYNPAAATVLTNILADIAAVQDEIGEDKELYIQISTTVKNTLLSSTEVAKYINTRDMSIRSMNILVEALNGHALIGTPSAYQKTIFNLADGVSSGQTDGGLTADAFAQSINWIVCARDAVDAIARPQITKVIDPDLNQDGEYWKIMFSIYHGVWAYDNKVKGLRVSLNSSLGTGYVTSVDATAAGQTTITFSSSDGGAAYAVPEGYGLFYKTDSSTAPSVTQGTALDSTWTLMESSQQNIAATNSHKITVALAALGSKLPIASGNATIVVA